MSIRPLEPTRRGPLARPAPSLRPAASVPERGAAQRRRITARDKESVDRLNDWLARTLGYLYPEAEIRARVGYSIRTVSSFET